MFVAVWVDDYDGDFGVYKAFTSRKACIDYLVDTVFERAGNFGVKVRENCTMRRSLSRDAVRRRIEDDKQFTLAIGRKELPELEDTVTVGYRELELPR